MSYYLGKVGRAGARLVSSARDLYYDVNAAYLTGAVDIVAVRQADGSLKTTPFHVRFGKLGVLRTGDWKEVEMVVNGKPVDMHMRIDESGQAFFAEPKTCESTSESTTTDGESKEDRTEDQIAIGLNQLSLEGQVAKEDHSPPKQTQKSHDTHVIRSKPDQWDQPNLAPNRMDSIVEESLQKDTSNDKHLHGQDESGRRESELSEEGGAEGGVNHYSSSLPDRSSPIGIPVKDASTLGYDTDHCSDVCCALPHDLEVLSDSAIDDRHSDKEGRGYSALSDTEVEVKDRLSSKLWDWSSRNNTKGSATPPIQTVSSQEEMKKRQPQQAKVDRSGFWSALTGILKRRKRRRFSSIEDGIYLDDIDADMDPEELSKFFPSSSTGDATGIADQTSSSGIGSSPTLSPSPSHTDLPSPSHTVPPSHPQLHAADPHKDETQKLISTLDDVALSLCGGLGQGSISEEAFLQSQVSFADFCSDPPSLFSNPNLVVRVAGKYYSWQVAAPMVMSAIVYLKPMSQDDTSKLVKKYMPRKTRQSFWYFWGRGSKELPDEDSVDGEAKAKSEGGTPVGSPHKWLEGEGGRGEVLSSDEEISPAPQTRPRQRSLKRKKSILSNLLTSEQLASLSLKPGANDVIFSVTTKFQGTAKARCTLYLWDYYDKIVVSDIDGTITRSDVAGQVFPFFGKDWTQNGVVELFNAIHSNGYHILYLSARAIGQAGYTKEFLRKIRRGSANLPDGPLCLAPFSLVKAFKKEVIEKRPEEFKIMCLKQIRSLFPEDANPFHAGFGNKSSDVKTYTQVEIPQSRIFTVNHKGLLKHEVSWTFQSSYTGLMEFVDAQFPPVKTTDLSEDQQHTKEEFNTFNYWREPLLNELPFQLPNL